MPLPFVWKIRDCTLSLNKPLIMGILNLTPDSFADGGNFIDPDAALARALEMERDGADLIDIGAESTRPGAKEISIEEEAKRLFPALDLILSEVGIPVSLDTTKAEIAEKALDAGVSIINDVSGLQRDVRIADLVRTYEAGLIVMHRRGTPETMQSLTQYEDLILDIKNELLQSVDRAIAAGVAAGQIAIDPGLGFSKTVEQNFEILRSLPDFKSFSLPLVVGASRKSFLGKLTGQQNPEERVFASAAVAVLAVERGADILRVHDVRATKDVLAVAREVSQ